ncbi:MAG: alpha/beta hydrolase [Dechloromonas sp.]|nr:MAG: alpha/beta hydrolase [Dechloromonas sp.]
MRYASASTSCLLRTAAFLLGWVCVAVPANAGETSIHWSVLVGPGDATVVLQSGLGDGESSWRSLRKQLAKQARVFSYDRPGYGESASVSGSRSPCDIADELHHVLTDAGLHPPYVLVGHSLGGLYQHAFAQRYPDEVAALVLIDATPPGHGARLQERMPQLYALASRAAGLSGAGREEFRDQDVCLDASPSAAQVTALPARFPVRVLMRSDYSILERGEFRRLWETTPQRWQALWPQASVVVVPHSGHYIHQEQTRAVMQVVESLLAPVAESNQGAASPP